MSIPNQSRHANCQVACQYDKEVGTKSAVCSKRCYLTMPRTAVEPAVMQPAELPTQKEIDESPHADLGNRPDDYVPQAVEVKVIRKKR